jgi:hypothetical protein
MHFRYATTLAAEKNVTTHYSTASETGALALYTSMPAVP